MSRQEQQRVNGSNRQTLLTQTQNTQSQIHINDQPQFSPLEKLIDKADGQGRYQFCSFVIFCTMWFLAGTMLLGQGFFFEDQYTCKNIEDKQQCEKFICSLPRQKRGQSMQWHSNSIIFAFEEDFLICELDYLKPILTSLLYFGSLVGFFIFPFLADNWGRKITTRISWIFFIVGLLVIGIGDSPNMIGLGQFFAGFGCNPAITLSYSFINEQCLRKSRQYYGIGIQVFLAVGECAIGFLFLPAFSWRYIIFGGLGISILVLFSLSYLSESAKFLISRSKKQTLKSLNEIAIKNKRPLISEQQINQIQVKVQEHSGATLLDLFRYRSLRWKTIATGLSFLAIQVIYYGTTLNLQRTGYDKLTNQQIVGVSEAVGYIGAQLIISKVKRKRTIFSGLLFSSLLCLGLAALSLFQTDDNVDIIKLAGSIGLIFNRLILCGAWAILYVYIAQLFPTKVRSLGFGWSSAMGTIGSTMSPYLIFACLQLNINSWIPPGAIGFVCCLPILCLKETKGKPLEDQIEELKKHV